MDDQEQVLAAVKANPGGTWKEIAAATGFKSGKALKDHMHHRDIDLATLRSRAGVASPPYRPHKAEAPEPIERQVEHLRFENKRVQKLLEEQEKRLDARAELDAMLTEAVKALKPTRGYVAGGKRAHGEIVAAQCFADFHTSEVISEEETEGFGVYNWAVEQARAHYATDRFLDWIRAQRKAYVIDHAVIPLLGDFVSGEIHDELVRTNEFDPPVAAAYCGELLAELIGKIASEFKSVRVEAVTADNHGRTDRKKPYKRKGERNWNYVVYALAEALLSKHKNVTLNRPKSQKHTCQIAGHTFLLEHGDNVRGWMGIPLYGMIRMRGKEADRRQRRGGFDYILVGHWHNGWHLQGMYGVGALTGTSELDEGEARHAKPSQTAFLCHERHGLFNLVEWDLSEAKP